ncbi:hypothetical protein ACOMHN_058506 [Nucella lapillus]
MCCFDDKSHTRLTLFFTAASTPKECVAVTSLCQLAFVGEACLTEGRDVNFVASKFPGHKRSPSLGRVRFDVVEQSSNVL